MKIRGEYWIIDGRIEFADGDVGDQNHEMMAINHISSSHLEKIYGYSGRLGLKVPSLMSLEEEATESAQYLLKLISEKLFATNKNVQQVWSEIEKQCGIDNETLKTIMNDKRSDPRTYVMKREGWIAVRSNNIELFGLNSQKMRELALGLDNIVEEEFNDEEVSDEDLEFNLFDHKTNKSMDLTLHDIKEGNLFRPKTLPQTKYNNLAMPIPTGKEFGRETWRNTSEGVNHMKKKKKKKKGGLKMALNTGGEPVLIGASFKDWLIHMENKKK